MHTDYFYFCVSSSLKIIIHFFPALLGFPVSFLYDLSMYSIAIFKYILYLFWKFPATYFLTSPSWCFPLLYPTIYSVSSYKFYLCFCFIEAADLLKDFLKICFVFVFWNSLRNINSQFSSLWHSFLGCYLVFQLIRICPVLVYFGFLFFEGEGLFLAHLFIGFSGERSMAMFQANSNFPQRCRRLVCEFFQLFLSPIQQRCKV